MEVTYKFMGGPLDGLILGMADKQIGALLGGWLWVPPLLRELQDTFAIVPLRLDPRTGQVQEVGQVVHEYAVIGTIVEGDHAFVTAMHVEAFSSTTWAGTRQFYGGQP